jgi:hypothetical protein
MLSPSHCAKTIDQNHRACDRAHECDGNTKQGDSGAPEHHAVSDLGASFGTTELPVAV